MGEIQDEMQLLQSVGDAAQLLGDHRNEPFVTKLAFDKADNEDAVLPLDIQVTIRR